jgi:hypothetical protein
MLHAARASHGEQASNRDFTLRAAASEADLAPLYGAAQRSLSDVIGRCDAFIAHEGEELLKVFEQCKRKVAYVFIAAVHIAVRQREELLLQRNGFCDQQFACEGAVSDTGSVAKTMP